MIYMRGQARDYDGWRQMGNSGWGWDDVLPYFRRSQNYFAGADEYHGDEGEWRVEQQRLSWEILTAFQDAAACVGIPKIDDFNRGDNFGSAYFRVNQRRGWRLNAAKAFLRPVMKRSNLRVQTKAQVKRIVIENGRAVGVEFWLDGALRSVSAKREVILAAGAIGSPHLLEVSGIGDAARLRDLGIDVVHHLPGVGENLQDHLQVRAAYKVTGTRTLNERASTWRGKLGIGLQYALFRSGPMSMAPSQLGVFAKSDPSFETPNLQFHVQPLTLEKFGEPLHKFPAFTASVANLRPESRGSVHARSSDAREHPSIRPNYLATAGDRQVAADALKLTRSIVAQAPLQKYRPEEFKPGAHIASDEELAQAAGDIATTIFHPVGTARMGADDRAVVDDRLRVRGIAGLRVIDASVMPTITSGNTNAPTTMIAEKGADLILGAA